MPLFHIKNIEVGQVMHISTKHFNVRTNLSLQTQSQLWQNVVLFVGNMSIFGDGFYFGFRFVKVYKVSVVHDLALVQPTINSGCETKY